MASVKAGTSGLRACLVPGSHLYAGPRGGPAVTLLTGAGRRASGPGFPWTDTSSGPPLALRPLSGGRGRSREALREAAVTLPLF